MKESERERRRNGKGRKRKKERKCFQRRSRLPPLLRRHSSAAAQCTVQQGKRHWRRAKGKARWGGREEEGRRPDNERERERERETCAYVAAKGARGRAEEGAEHCARLQRGGAKREEEGRWGRAAAAGKKRKRAKEGGERDTAREREGNCAAVVRVHGHFLHAQKTASSGARVALCGGVRRVGRSTEPVPALCCNLRHWSRGGRLRRTFKRQH